MIGKIPLAWYQLKREKMRLLIALLGIAFANMLMFVQLGFQDALLDSAVKFHKSVNGDIFLISPNSTALVSLKSFPLRNLYQTLSFEGVESVNAIYMGLGLWKNPDNKIEGKNDNFTAARSIFIIGFNPDESVFDMPAVNDKLDVIKQQDVVLFDQDSRGEFGSIAKWYNQGKTVVTEIDDRQVTIGGLFRLGPTFGANGNVITSDVNFLRLFKRRKKGSIEIGVIKVYPGADIDYLVSEMSKFFGVEKTEKGTIYHQGIKVLSKAGFIDFERSYWQKNTNIGFIFSLGTMMGFVVGIIIVYQILYTDVSDHLPEYATLKAMGYTDFYLLTVVFQESVILAILGYIPGGLIANMMYNLTKNATNLPIGMTQQRAILVLILTFIMCFVSGAIAVRKLSAADPADIF
ncbi:MAG TPA: ABC transporter permease DevC [Allocoleopsis sp.]